MCSLFSFSSVLWGGTQGFTQVKQEYPEPHPNLAHIQVHFNLPNSFSSEGN